LSLSPLGSGGEGVDQSSDCAVGLDQEGMSVGRDKDAAVHELVEIAQESHRRKAQMDALNLAVLALAILPMKSLESVTSFAKACESLFPAFVTDRDCREVNISAQTMVRYRR